MTVSSIAQPERPTAVGLLHIWDERPLNGRKHPTLCGRWVTAEKMAPNHEAVTCPICLERQAQNDALEI